MPRGWAAVRISAYIPHHEKGPTLSSQSCGGTAVTIMIAGRSRSHDLAGSHLARRLALSLLALVIALSVQQILHPYQAGAPPGSAGR